MNFARIPSGEFEMGSDTDGPVHEVRITRGFYMGRHEVTQGEWRRMMGDNPSHFQQCGEDCPVEQVSWHEARKFLAALERAAPGERFRLPTEAEWEYACRAGTTTPYSTGESLMARQANYDGPEISRGTTMRVGSFPPNAWGLYDMHGNVWEWCEDWFCPYPEGPAVDPVGVCAADKKIIRGGSWHFGADSARSSLRYTHLPGDRGFSLGFRVVRETR